MAQKDPGMFKYLPKFLQDNPLLQLVNAATPTLSTPALGVIRGAGSIGATALAPWDMAKDAIAGRGLSLQANQRRRADMDAAIRELGASTDSLLYAGPKLATEIAGTLPVGGLLGKAASAGLGGSKYAAPIVEGLKTGGMSVDKLKGAAGLLTRAITGATTGSVSAGLIDPQDTATGFKIGGTLPMIGPAFGLLKKTGGAIARNVFGATTGAGPEALKQAYLAGKTGGKAAEDFTGAMRGDIPIENVLVDAKANLAQMGAQKQAAYRSGMIDIKADKSVLDMSGISKAVNDSQKYAYYNGQAINDDAANVLAKVQKDVTDWAKLPAQQFRTPEGLDALKQKIGGRLESIPFEQEKARAAVGNVYDAVRSEISSQAPTYSNVMKDYAESSQVISEIEKALSLGKKASADTSIRKLQSLMRNNVNANYGQRMELANVLQNAGGKNIMPALAGQSVNSFIPRGLQAAGASTGGAALAYLGMPLQAAGIAATSSPRLAGEAFYAAGKGARMLTPKQELTNLLRSGLYKSAPQIGANYNVKD